MSYSLVGRPGPAGMKTFYLVDLDGCGTQIMSRPPTNTAMTVIDSVEANTLEEAKRAFEESRVGCGCGGGVGRQR